MFTYGTGNRQAAAFFVAAIAAAQALGLRAIILTPHLDQLPAHLPPSVLWQAYLPLARMLPHVRAVVHHGGIGTTAEALRAGIPQLIVPLAFDQFDNGARVQRVEGGLSFGARRLSRRRLERALRTVTSSERIRTQCRELAARLKDAPALDAALDLILASAHDMYGIEQKN